MRDFLKERGCALSLLFDLLLVFSAVLHDKKTKTELLAVNTVQMDMASLNLVKPEVDAHFNLYPVEVGLLV